MKGKGRDPRESVTLKIVSRYINVPDPETGEACWVDVVAIFELADLAKRAGADAAFRVLQLGAGIGKGSLIADDDQNLRSIFDRLLNYVAQLPGGSRRSYLLGISYTLLTGGTFTRAEVADWASRMQGRTMSPDAWRRAVDKWAREQEYVPLDLPTGRPKRRKAAK